MTPETANPLHVVIEDDDNSVRVDPRTGAVEVDQPDGGVVVNFSPRRTAKEGDAEDKWFANLADDIDPMQLGVIANELCEAIAADHSSRSGYLATRAAAFDLLGTKIEKPRAAPGDATSGEGMATVTNPLLLEAILKGWANAQAELLPANGPVKIRDDGSAQAARDELAESFERDLNHWFTTTAAEYYPDTSHMLLWGVYFGGSGFKKVYRCPMRRRPVSESTDAADLIVSDTTKDLRACGRITHEIKMRPSVMKRMKLIGAYRDVTLTQPTASPNEVAAKIGAIQGTTPPSRPEDQPYNLWETQCELDLDQFIPADSKFKGEGIPLPYLVTLDKDAQEVLAIRRDWDKEDEEATRKRMYVKYPYVPGPGFYGTGMLNILGNASAAMTAAWREALDAGMYANFPGGVRAKVAGRNESSQIKVGPAEFAPIETSGLPIQQAIMALPYKDVTPGLMTLMDKITAQAKAVSGAPEIPIAEGIQNVPVGTMLAAVEQATTIINAAHKGMHTAQAEEFQLIVDLFRENPKDFWRSNKLCPPDYWNEQKFLNALDQCQSRLVPQSDPNVPSHIHRVAKALGLVNLMTIPAFMGRLDPKEVLIRCLQAIREDPKGLVIEPAPQQPQIGPADIAKMLEANAKVTDARTKANKVHIEATISWLKEQVRMREAQAKERVAAIDYQGKLMSGEHDGVSAERDYELGERAQTLAEDVAASDAARKDAELAHEIERDQRELAIEAYKARNPPRRTDQ